MKQTTYQDQVRRCSAEIQRLFPRLDGKHSPLILIAALTEHVGGSLYVSQAARTCSPERARAIIERVRQIAFAP